MERPTCQYIYGKIREYSIQNARPPKNILMHCAVYEKLSNEEPAIVPQIYTMRREFMGLRIILSLDLQEDEVLVF